MLEVGIDQQHDRFLDRDPKASRKSDRQVVAVATSLTPDGTLTLYPRVSDFEIDVPTGDENLQANLLARLVTSGQPDVWSEGVPIVLDSAGPALQVALRPGRRVEKETEIEVLVSTFEPELSGIKMVEAVIEPSVAPTADNEKKPWEPGKPSEDGRWIVRLKTDKLEAGPHTVLVRAADKVENSSEAAPEVVEIIPKRVQRKLSEEEKKEREANTVTGQVLYGGAPLANASVELEPSPGPDAGPVTTNASGRFKFEKVPPGKYTIKARGLSRNYFRRAELPVEVQPRGKGPTEVTLNAK
jgi:hypothetical protein